MPGGLQLISNGPALTASGDLITRRWLWPEAGGGSSGSSRVPSASVVPEDSVGAVGWDRRRRRVVACEAADWHAGSRVAGLVW